MLLVCYNFLRVCRAFNGVKDMVGFRQTFNLSYGNGSEPICDDDVGSSAILVRTTFS